MSTGSIPVAISLSLKKKAAANAELTALNGIAPMKKVFLVFQHKIPQILMMIRMMIIAKNTKGGIDLPIESLTLICARNASSIVIPSQKQAHTIAPAYQ
ncbi:hypothetical protein CU633_20955 [Bacillus sp. V3-13]|nr:hypothetical protein CU633_20955 [Bacillus sp. V3-13]